MTRCLASARRKSLALAAGLLLHATAGAAAPAGSALDFELSDGQEFVRLSKLPPRLTILNFWRADCPPCVREMPLLARVARTGQARLVAIALQRPAETLAAPAVVLSALTQPAIALQGPGDPRGLLARFGNPRGVLPHTVVLDAQRQICAQHTGEVDETWLRATLSRCIADAAPR